jgi:hypothetical protein
MGLWSKKRSDGEPDSDDEDFIMPLNKQRPPPPPPSTEKSEPAKAAEAMSAARPEPPKEHGKPEPPPVPAASIPPRAEARPPQPAPPTSAFGIDEAVQLVRQLPTRNTDLVMQVVKKTLESVHVDVGQIIDGATKKEQVIEDRISTLRKEIERLEAQIAQSKKEIGQLESEQKEVTSVKERLLMAQKMEGTGDVTGERPGIERSPTGKITVSTTSPPARAAENTPAKS